MMNEHDKQMVDAKYQSLHIAPAFEIHYNVGERV
jgi:hypothetical protein